MFAIGVNTSGVYAAGGATLDEGKSFSLNDTATLHDGSRWTFISASTSITTGQLVAVDSSGYGIAATSAAAIAGRTAGVAQNAISSGSWGWVQIKGNLSVACLITCSSGTALYTSATAGSVDDTAASQVKVAGLTIQTSLVGAATTAGYAATDLYFAL